MGVQMEWCCGHFTGGNGSLYSIQSGGEDSRTAGPQKPLRTTLMLRACLDRLNRADRDNEDMFLTQHRNEQNFCHQM